MHIVYVAIYRCHASKVQKNPPLKLKVYIFAKVHSQSIYFVEKVYILYKRTPVEVSGYVWACLTHCIYQIS